MSEKPSFSGEVKKVSSNSQQERYIGYINRLPAQESPFLPNRALQEELDTIRFVRFFTHPFRRKSLSLILQQKNVVLFTGEKFVPSSRRAVEKHIHPEDRYFVRGKTLYIIPRKHLHNSNVFHDAPDNEVVSALSPEKKIAFQEKIKNTLDRAEREGMSDNYFSALSIALHLSLHNPKNFSLSPPQFDQLCTHTRIFYTRKMFSEMSGDEFAKWEQKQGRKGIAQKIRKKPMQYEKNLGFLKVPIFTHQVEGKQYAWSMLGEKEKHIINLSSFFTRYSLNGKTYGDFLHAVEREFSLPKGLLSALATHESKGDHLAVSSSYAFGLFQLLPIVSHHSPKASSEFFGNVNPFDVFLSAFRAAEKLQEDYQRTHSWKETIKSYNGGKKQEEYFQSVNKIHSQNTGYSLQETT